MLKMCTKRQHSKQIFVGLVLVSLVLMFVYLQAEFNSVILYDELPSAQLEAIESIRKDCGELCETVALGKRGPYFNHIKAPINCNALFQNSYIDIGHNLPQSPAKIPKQLYDDFSMNKRLKVSKWYFDEVYLGNTAKMPVWTETLINEWISLAKKGELKGNYGKDETRALQDGLVNAPGIVDGRVLVIGSERPWVEACVLEAGAKEVVTLEYGRIVSKHPQVTTLTPYQFRAMFYNQSLGTFDAVVTFSSVEHSGLGRYGDALNPWGDIIAIARSWCVTKNGGSLTIGVMYDNENDHIKFNAGRWYGQIRYPYLTTNWKQHYRGIGKQRVHVLIKEPLDFTKSLNEYLQKPNAVQTIRNKDRMYSQARQDEVVYNIFPKDSGFYIDIGANDGQLFSNTLWLERKHYWRGLLIEANPDLCRKIDFLQRHAWRLCACISDTLNQTKFIQSGPVGGMESEIDEFHIRQIKNTRTITVPCFNMLTVLDEIRVHHIDYFSLDVEGAELIVLNTLKNDLISKNIVVDIWTIEYRVYDGKQNIEDKSIENLKKIRSFFNEIGGYAEHSHLDNLKNNKGAALDVVYVNIETWCKIHQKLPDKTNCPGK